MYLKLGETLFQFPFQDSEQPFYSTDLVNSGIWLLKFCVEPLYIKSEGGTGASQGKSPSGVPRIAFGWLYV